MPGDLVNTLHQDGPEPSDEDERQVNELLLAARPGGAGGRIKGVFDAPSFDALLAALDSLCKPLPEERRSLAERRSAAATGWPNCAADASTPVTCRSWVGYVRT